MTWRVWGDCASVAQSADLTALWMVARDAQAVEAAKRIMQSGDRLTVEIAETLLRDFDPAYAGVAGRDHQKKTKQFIANVQRSKVAAPDDIDDMMTAPPDDDDDDPAIPPDDSDVCYTWPMLLDDAPTDPMDHWRTATVYDAEKMREDVTSLVAYWWRLAEVTRPEGGTEAHNAPPRHPGPDRMYVPYDR